MRVAAHVTAACVFLCASHVQGADSNVTRNKVSPDAAVANVELLSSSSSATSSLLPRAPACGDTYPSCGGVCPGTQSCQAVIDPPFGCICIGPPVPCGDTYPLCSGACPAGQACLPQVLHQPYSCTCGVPNPPQVSRVELTQTIQDLDNTVPLLALKRTFVRVYLDTWNGSIANASVEATIQSFPDLRPVRGPITIGPQYIQSPVHRGLLGDTLNFELPILGPGDYLLTLTPLACAGIPSCPRGNAHQTVFHLYSSVGLHVRVFYDTRNTFSGLVPKSAVEAVMRRVGASFPTFNAYLHDSNDQQDDITWADLAMYRASAISCDTSARANGLPPPCCSDCFFLAVPYVPPGIAAYGLATPGEYRSQAAINASDIPLSAAVAAQEIAHCFYRYHASGDHGETPRVDENFPYPHGAISDLNAYSPLFGTSIHGKGRYYGIDPGTDPAAAGVWRLIQPEDPSGRWHHHDFMSYGGWEPNRGYTDKWASAYTYDALCHSMISGDFDTFYQRARDFGTPPFTLPACGSVSGTGLMERHSASLSIGPRAAGTDFLFVRGEIGPDDVVTFQPAYLMDAADTNGSDPESPYTVELIDAVGNSLANAVIAHATHGDTAPIAAFLPWSDATSAVVVKEAGTEIARLSRSENSPSIVNVSLPHGSLTMPVTATWQITHPDPTAAVVAAVFFSRDGGASWEPIEVDNTKGSMVLDPATLPGTENGRIRIQASDGINNVTVDGPPDLQIASKPPRISVLEPAEREYVPRGGRLILRANAVSPQSGLVDDQDLTWYHESRVLGQGPVVEATALPPGLQELRVQAVDTVGVTTDRVVQVYLDPQSVTVLGDSPGTFLPSIGSNDEGGTGEDLLIIGKRLVLKEDPPGQTKALWAVSTAPEISVAIPGDANDPTVVGATLSLVFAPDGGPAEYPGVTYELPAENWEYVARPGPSVGYRYRDPNQTAGPIRFIRIKQGRLKIHARGPLIGFHLIAEPDAVPMALRIGNKRYCMRFGDHARFHAGRAYRSRDSAPGSSCL